MGTVFASNSKAYSQWRRSVDQRTQASRALDPTRLEVAVMSFAMSNPEYVVVGNG